jgi:hypothetical protein
MRFFVAIPKSFDGHVCVNLRCSETGVTQQLLNRSQISASIEKVGCG